MMAGDIMRGNKAVCGKSSPAPPITGPGSRIPEFLLRSQQVC